MMNGDSLMHMVLYCEVYCRSSMYRIYCWVLQIFLMILAKASLALRLQHSLYLSIRRK